MRSTWGYGRHGMSSTGRGIALVGVLALVGSFAAFGDARAAIPEYTVTAIPSPTPQSHLPTNVSAASFGDRMRTLGDVDKDGITDVVISNSNFDNNNVVDVGRLWIFSGRTGMPLRTIDHPEPQMGTRFGFWSAGPGDVNGDTVPDIVTSAPSLTVDGVAQGRVYVISGQTGAVIRAVNHPDAPQMGGDFGGNIIAPGDLNGDRVGDFVATSSGTFVGAGAAYAINGATGALLYKVLNPANPMQASSLGFGASEVGDVNRDGTPDYQVGAPRFDEGLIVDSGRSYTINGRTGALIYTLQNPDLESMARFGQADADGLAPGDVTGDGTPDIYVNGFLSDDGAILNSGAAYLFNGATGAPIRTLRDPVPQSGGQFGAANASAGDIDRDGRPDSLISTRGNIGRVTIFGGPNLTTTLATFNDPQAQPNALFGSSMSHRGDVNGDRQPDYFITARSADVDGVANVGLLYAYTSVPPPAPPAAPAAPAPPPLVPTPVVARVRATAARPQVTRATQRKGERQIRVTVVGRLAATQGRACAGAVAVKVSVGRKLLRTVRANVGSNCRFTASTRVSVNSLPRKLRPRKRKVVLAASYRFDGNAQLLDATSQTVRATVSR